MAIKLADIASKASNVSTIGGAITGGINLVKSLFGNSDKKRREQEAEQDARQLRMQGEFNKMGVTNSKELADYEQMLKMKMWQDTNYSAQMREAEKAGVSKAALMGAGGGSTAQGASVSGMGGGNAADAAATQQANQQSELVKAQIRNMDADAALKTTQAQKTGGIDTRVAEGTLENVIANTKNTEAKTALTAIQTKMAEIDWEIKDITTDAEIIKGLQVGEMALQELQQAKNNTWISNETYKTETEIVKTNLIGMQINNAATKQGIELDKARIKEIAANINARLEEIKVAREGQQVSKDNMVKLTETMLLSAGIQGASGLANNIVGQHMKSKGVKGAARKLAPITPVEGTGKSNTEIIRSIKKDRAKRWGQLDKLRGKY